MEKGFKIQPLKTPAIIGGMWEIRTPDLMRVKHAL
jgi:hypothetical protein